MDGSLMAQMDYIYFIYGLAFVLLFAICAIIRRDEPRNLPWMTLGLFGLTHGINEWMEMIIVPLGDNTSYAIARLTVMGISFMCLLEFGRTASSRIWRACPSPWIHVPLLIGALAGGFAGLSGLNATIRYCLGLPGALWAALILFHAARATKKAAVGLILAAAALACYAVAGGIVVPQASFFPASALNAVSFLEVTGWPIQVVRAVLAVLLSASLWAYYQQRWSGMVYVENRPVAYHGLQMTVALVGALAIGWVVVQVVGGHADRDIRESIVNYTRIAATAIDPKVVAALEQADLAARKSAQECLQRKLSEIHSAGPQFRWVHLLMLKAQDRHVSIVLSAPEGNPDGSRRQANAYQRPPGELFNAFAGEAVLAGPYSDESGTFLSGFAPIRDPSSGKVIGVLALDLAARRWSKDVAEFRLAMISVVFVISLLLVGSFVMRRRSWEAGEQIAAREAALAEAQEVAHLGSWTYDPATDRMAWSREMFQILGCDPRDTPPSYSEQRLHIAAEDRPALDDAMRKAVRENAAIELESSVSRPSGALRRVVLKIRPKHGPGGAGVWLVGTIQDITDRKAGEEALQQERNLLRTLIDQLPDFIYVKDVRGRFLVANIAAARLMGAGAPDDLLGKTDADFYSPAMAEEYRRDEERILSGGQSLINKDEPHLDSSGVRRNVLTTKLPMRDPHGRIVGLVGISRDITDRKRAEEEITRLNATLEQRVQQRTAELTAANMELETFTYSVSHDLMAPLRHMIGFLNLLKGSLKGSLDPTSAGHFGDVERAAERAALLIEELLEFSRIGRAEMHRGAVSLRSLLDDVLRDVAPDTAGRSVQWKIGELPDVVGDSAMIRQVLANLIDNALKFTGTRERAVIEIGSYPAPGEHVVFVRDNGVGFDPAYAAKLFGVFQRLHPPSRFKGTGVGLASVRRIVQRHGGRTWAESAEEKGATFYFTFPT